MNIKDFIKSWKRLHTITFYREDSRWYADIAGVSKEDNEMISGSDVLLENLSCLYGNTNIITLLVSTKFCHSLFWLKGAERDVEGKTYIVHGETANKLGFNNTPIWLCDVVTKVFGYFPNKIYVKKIIPGKASLRGLLFPALYVYRY